VKSKFDDAVAELRGPGSTLTEARCPSFRLPRWRAPHQRRGALDIREFLQVRRRPELKDPYAPYQQEITRALTGADLVKAWRMRTVLQEKMADFQSRYA